MSRIPQVESVETALRLYYEKHELTTSDMSELFGHKLSKSKIYSLKNEVRLRMAEKGVMPYDTRSIDTATAYEMWGLNASDLENRLNKLRKLKLTREKDE